MWKILLLIAAVCIVAGMIGYAVYLLLALQKQKKALQLARQNRINRIKESLEIIAKAMLNGDCNLSEGVLRLKMLLEPVGMALKNYPAMWQLYEMVEGMPTHNARKELKKNERMRLDLRRESAEAELESKIKLELHRLLTDIQTL
ncbi:DUF2489 domain-containing protein [Aggregatibacter actinomycetemcomitans]|uniref:DUF2489 domain-containing protein n=1 Tax=Aggregatibacter actinomycetemcomitans TaxID=714 RepID=A0A142G0X2_AGGAC|nr:DUF2489 domain-containing protein [Aggregatibacter actinomycetemcomitans]AFI87396.1 hypothetical protein D7S_01657 [Aggregatibacter actinomycetemcomitans D7S-1]KYK95115.1 hypothetical protein SA3733_05360 [Aggregatibacter actinomycetemcomitans serotype d str. SA3733]ACX83454.1 hypothetical protein D11S_2100 [Aggregatibacter actinomycetemcomitans D11S-1]AHN70837.1 hypothetical protein CF65_00195 [Aggregatibacter actinomycetemcomitans HK1651]AMQ92387.1 hypothetical protein ACT74_07135 [Aggreg